MGKIILPDKKEIDFEGRTDDVSDMYHTFSELYELRSNLFLSLLKEHRYQAGYEVFKTKLDHEKKESEGYFILGMDYYGKQISMHLHNDMWDDCNFPEYEYNKNYDGHTSADVLERIKKL